MIVLRDFLGSLGLNLLAYLSIRMSTAVMLSRDFLFIDSSNTASTAVPRNSVLSVALIDTFQIVCRIS